MPDPSVLIFVALAVAWAAYLIPLALKHHDEGARSRAVDRFSHRLRVLARREPVDNRTARLMAAGAEGTGSKAGSRAERRAARKLARAEREAAGRQAAAGPVAPSPSQLRERRAAARRATRRRRNVLAVLMVALVTVVALAAFAVLAWPYVAIPVAVILAWLVACRVMVKGEQRVLAPARRPSAARMPAERPAEESVEPTEREASEPAVELGVGLADATPAEEIDPMEDTSAGISAVVDPAMWDPVPVTLPTYTTKPAAVRRAVHPIDLESTGVWTSGRTEADAQLAREADAADQEARKRRDGDDQQAVGS